MLQLAPNRSRLERLSRPSNLDSGRAVIRKVRLSLRRRWVKTMRCFSSLFIWSALAASAKPSQPITCNNTGLQSTDP